MTVAQATFDRWGRATRPGCPADTFRLGYVPFARYRSSYWRHEYTCRGYFADGTVEIVTHEPAGDVIRRHSTPLDRRDERLS